MKKPFNRMAVCSAFLLCLAATAPPALAFYDPSTQRWINRDPIGERGGVNLYQFVGGNPLSVVDPRGTECTLYSLCYVVDHDATQVAEPGCPSGIGYDHFCYYECQVLTASSGCVTRPGDTILGPARAGRNCCRTSPLFACPAFFFQTDVIP